MERCPNCNARQRGEETCHRCGMDLTTLLALEARAEYWEHLAVARLSVFDRTGAATAAREALRWQRRDLAAAVLGFTESLAAEARRRGIS